MKLILNRIHDNGLQTEGNLILKDQKGKTIYNFCSLELPWEQNKKQVSCIQDGNYILTRRYSLKHGWCFEVKNVLNRENILIHSGNFNSQTLGCILVGTDFDDINFDKLLDVINSKHALRLLSDVIKTDIILEIKSLWKQIDVNLK